MVSTLSIPLPSYTHQLEQKELGCYFKGQTQTPHPTGYAIQEITYSNDKKWYVVLLQSYDNTRQLIMFYDKRSDVCKTIPHPFDAEKNYKFYTCITLQNHKTSSFIVDTAALS